MKIELNNNEVIKKLEDICEYLNADPEYLINRLVREEFDRTVGSKYEVYDFRYFINATCDNRGYITVPTANGVGGLFYKGINYFIVKNGSTTYIFNKSDIYTLSREGKMCSPIAIIPHTDYSERVIKRKVREYLGINFVSQSFLEGVPGAKGVALLWLENNIKD